jgi:hypothetical protein
VSRDAQSAEQVQWTCESGERRELERAAVVVCVPLVATLPLATLPTPQNSSRPLRGNGSVIWNIIDRRERQHRWKSITAIIEPTSHDNSCADSDQVDESAEEFFAYDQRAAISLAHAIIWAQSQPFAVTLYLYDLGDGIR